MSWTDKPTDSQLETIYQWFRWVMPTAKASDSVKWLGDHANRKQVSDEMTRIRDLKKSRNLSHERCFESDIWGDYLFKEGTLNKEVN